MTGKKAMVVLILEDPQKEMVYFNRVKELGKGDISEPDNFEQVESYIKDFYEKVPMV